MYCSGCGAMIDTSARFCSRCRVSVQPILVGTPEPQIKGS